MIFNQLKRLGASADWSRERFTMDEGLSRAVLEVFVTLYKQGLIYKDKRLVNWDPKLLTAISDLEVEQVELNGNLWHFRYPVDGVAYDPEDPYDLHHGRDDAARDDARRYGVAVHPDDERYKHLVGKTCRSCRSSDGRSRSSPTNIPIRRRAAARSRSRRRTTSTTSRSASATSFRRSTS